MAYCETCLSLPLPQQRHILIEHGQHRVTVRRRQAQKRTGDPICLTHVKQSLVGVSTADSSDGDRLHVTSGLGRPCPQLGHPLAKPLGLVDAWEPAFTVIDDA